MRRFDMEAAKLKLMLSERPVLCVNKEYEAVWFLHSDNLLCTYSDMWGAAHGLPIGYHATHMFGTAKFTSIAPQAHLFSKMTLEDKLHIFKLKNKVICPLIIDETGVQYAI